jgi:hypothetical protein
MKCVGTAIGLFSARKPADARGETVEESQCKTAYDGIGKALGTGKHPSRILLQKGLVARGNEGGSHLDIAQDRSGGT